MFRSSRVRFFFGSILLSPLACLGAIALASWLAQAVLSLKTVEYDWAPGEFGMVGFEQPSGGAVLLARACGACAVAAVNLMLFCYLAPAGSSETAQLDAGADGPSGSSSAP